MTKEKHGGKLGSLWNLKTLLFHNPGSEPPLGRLSTPLHDAAAKSARSTRAFMSAENARSRAANQIQAQSLEDGEVAGE